MNTSHSWFLLAEDWLPLVDSWCRDEELGSEGTRGKTLQETLGWKPPRDFVQLSLHSELIPASDEAPSALADSSHGDRLMTCGCGGRPRGPAQRGLAPLVDVGSVDQGL